MGIEYNKGQRRIIDDAKNFYRHSSNQVYEFGGYAGTGKSVVLNAIKEELGFQDQEIAAMSYIGQAAIVMRMKGFPFAKTCHSWLYTPTIKERKDKKGHIVYNEYFNRPICDMGFTYKSLDGIKAIFIDEGGAVPYDIAEEIESRGLKIFVAGDPGQLPPPMSRPKYLVNPNIPVLDEIMRQNEGSYILKIGEMVRKGIPVNPGMYGDAMVIEHGELDLETMAHADKIICGTNKTREGINKVYRKHILGYMDEIPHYGEKVICRKNNWNMEVDGINLANGLIGTVVNFPDISAFNGNTFFIDFQPDLFNSRFSQIQVDYKYFIANTEQRKQLSISKYYTGEKFEFAYAITAHVSQGAQYSQGIYIEDYMGGDMQRNVNYTGVTRFSNKLIYVKPKRKKYY